MAMDKEKLLTHFQERYLSRQEVLFMLPLNYSIDSFWPELLNRRKARAVLLPLFNASGMPYWYVLTPGMISASERLCEEAIAQDAGFDPYRAGMTSAMTEEMFFTSYVEGAQIPLHEAMDFLSRGTEPESIQEQMIWNNRHAWSEMVRGLYHPLDESFVRGLAYMLTEEMDGCAEDYRQADNHPIAAMQNESYDVLPARSIPERMQQYYAFLQDPGVHPLIKAAVAQAYLLVARPFPEGNERLSRMMSSAVLMRCGYDFFRDISVSSVIARENYRYYKSMREIIRTENGGDLTYFIEYFLELLVRAVDARKERLRRREQEALEKEREMARQPLRTKPAENEDGSGFTDQTGNGSKSAGAKTSDTMGKQTESEIVDSPPSEEPIRLPLEEFLCKVDSIYGEAKMRKSAVRQRIRELLNRGILSFSTQQWSGFWHIGNKSSNTCCNTMMNYGLVTRAPAGRSFTYTFLVDPSTVGGADSNAATPSVPEVSEEMQSYLRDMQNSDETRKRRIGSMLVGILDEGRSSFSFNDWKRLTQVSKSVCTDDIRIAISMGLIYRDCNAGFGIHSSYKIQSAPPLAGHLSDLTIAEKYYLARIYSQYGEQKFTIDACVGMFGLSRHQTTVYLEGFCERGITKRYRNDMNRTYSYFLLITPDSHPECFSTAEIKSQKRQRTYPSVAVSSGFVAV